MLKKNPEHLLREQLKLEIAKELGLLEKVLSRNWSSLNAAEAGRIGGKMAARLKGQL